MIQCATVPWWMAFAQCLTSHTATRQRGGCPIAMETRTVKKENKYDTNNAIIQMIGSDNKHKHCGVSPKHSIIGRTGLKPPKQRLVHVVIIHHINRILNVIRPSVDLVGDFPTACNVRLARRSQRKCCHTSSLCRYRPSGHGSNPCYIPPRSQGLRGGCHDGWHTRLH